METIHFPSTVTTIGEQAFAGCTGLGAVTLPENLKDIKARAFQGCTSLTLPDRFPERTNHIYEDAFNGCASLTSITFPDVNGSLSIYDHAFENCTSLTDVVFTGYIMRIGSGVFEGCSNLTNVTFQQDGMKTDGGDSMFSGCASLTSLRVPLFTDRGKIVPADFCNGCSALTTVWLNADLTAVGDGAFQDCGALTDVYFRGTAEQWSAVSIGENNDGLGRATIHYAEYIPFGTVIVQPSEHGVVTPSKTQPAFHTTVRLEATPDEGYQLARIAVMNPDGEEISLRRLVENQYLFYPDYRFVTVISEFEPVTAGHGTEESPYLISGDHCPMMLYTGWYKVVGSVTAQVTLVIQGDVHLILDDGATLNATNGINVPEGNTLTLSGSGALNAKPQPLGSGIGAGYLENGGTVIIDGGTIKAAGTSGSAGIGGALGNGTIIGGPGGTIIINGGYVTATADPYAAGIGGNQANGAIVIINGGVIHATGGPQAAAIGSGAYVDQTGATSSVTIADGLKVTAAGAEAPALTTDRVDACAENSEVWIEPCGHDGDFVLSPAGETFCAHCGLAASVPDLGSGTASDPWKIGTAARWNMFASAVANGLDTSGKYFRLTDSVAVTTMMGTSGHPFSGSFDGCGNTLTVSLTASSGGKGPFAHVSGASFAHLRVAGTITTSVADTGGLVGYSTGCTIVDCVSDIHIVANGGNGHAGFVGSFSGDMAITGSVYTGSIVGANASYCAGFAGSGGGTVDDSVYDGLINGKDNNNTFLRQKDRADNCYYTNRDGIQRVKGKQAIPVLADEGVIIDFGTPKAAYPTSGITAYNTGLMYNGLFCAGPNEAVTLGLSGASAYIVSAGTLTGTGGAWTLTMPAEGAVIIATPVFDTATFTMPSALTTIEESAFKGITAMTTVDASHCMSIGKDAFKGCTGLTKIRLPKDCSISDSAFDGCGAVFVFAPAGGTTETSCSGIANCVFVAE